MNTNVIELDKRRHVNQRILKAKAAFTTRRVNLKEAVTLVSGVQRPKRAIWCWPGWTVSASTNELSWLTAAGPGCLSEMK